MNFDKLIGRSGMTQQETELLMAVTGDSDIHIEIGCLWGSSAIASAIAGAKLVFTIDPMNGGWWNTKDPSVDLRPTRELVELNFSIYAVADRIKVIQLRSSPFPMPDIQADTFLIDGDHSFEGIKTDWEIAIEHTKKSILIHDYGKETCPGVTKLVDEIAMNSGWKLVKQVDTLMVFSHV